MPNGTYGGVRGGRKFPLLDFWWSKESWDEKFGKAKLIFLSP